MPHLGACLMLWLTSCHRSDPVNGLVPSLETYFWTDYDQNLWLTLQFERRNHPLVLLSRPCRVDSIYYANLWWSLSMTVRRNHECVCLLTIINLFVYRCGCRQHVYFDRGLAPYRCGCADRIGHAQKGADPYGGSNEGMGYSSWLFFVVPYFLETNHWFIVSFGWKGLGQWGYKSNM